MKINKIKMIFKKTLKRAIFLFSLPIFLLLPIAINTNNVRGSQETFNEVNYESQFDRAFKVDDSNKPKTYKELGLVKNISIQGFFKGSEKDLEVLEIMITNDESQSLPYKLVRINTSKGSDVYELNQMIEMEEESGTSKSSSTHSLNDQNILSGYEVKGDNLPSRNNVSIEISLDNPSIINNIEIKISNKDNKKIGGNEIIFRKVSLLSQNNRYVNTINFYNLTSRGVEIKTNNEINTFALKNIFNSDYSDAYSTEYPASAKPFVWVPNVPLLLGAKIVEFYTDNDNIRYVVPQLHGGKLEVWIHESDHSTYDDIGSGGKIRNENIYNDSQTLAVFLKEITDINLQKSILSFINNVSSNTINDWDNLTINILSSITRNNDVVSAKSELELSWFSPNNIANLGINELSNLEYFSFYKGINAIVGYSLYSNDEVAPVINISKQSWFKKINSLETINFSNSLFSKSTYLLGNLNELFEWLIDSPSIKYVNLENYIPYKNVWRYHTYDPENIDTHTYNPKFVITAIKNEKFIRLQDIKAREKKILKINFGNYENSFIPKEEFEAAAEYKDLSNFNVKYLDGKVYLTTSSTYDKGVIEDPVVRPDYKSTINVNGMIIDSILVEGEWIWNFAENNILERDITIYYVPTDTYMTKAYFESLNLSPEMSTDDLIDNVTPSISDKTGIKVREINYFEKMFSENDINYNNKFYLNVRDNDENRKEIDVRLKDGRYILNLENEEFNSIKYMFEKNVTIKGQDVTSYYLFNSDTLLLSLYNINDIKGLKINQISTKRDWNDSNTDISEYFKEKYISQPKNMDESVIAINNQEYSNKAIFNSRIVWDQKYFYNSELKENFSIADIIYFDGEQYLTKKYLESIGSLDKNNPKFNYEKLESVVMDPEIDDTNNLYKTIPNPQKIINDLEEDVANNINTYIDFSLLSIKIGDRQLSPYLYNGTFIWPIDIKDVVAEVFNYNTKEIFYITKDDVSDYINDSNYSVNSVEIPLQSFTSIPLKLPAPNNLITLNLRLNRANNNHKVHSRLVNGSWKYYYSGEWDLNDIIFINKNNEYLTAEYINQDYNDNLSKYNDLKHYISENGISSLEFSDEYVTHELWDKNTIQELTRLSSEFKDIIKNGYFYDGVKYDYQIVNGNIIIPKNVIDNSKFIYFENGIPHYELNINFQQVKFQRNSFSIVNKEYNNNLIEDDIKYSIADYIKNGDNLLNINIKGDHFNILIKKSRDENGKIIYGIDSTNIFVQIKYVTEVNGKIIFYTDINDVSSSQIANLSSVDIFSNQNKETNEKQKIIDSIEITNENQINNNKFKMGLYSLIISLSTIFVSGIIILIRRIRIGKRG